MFEQIIDWIKHNYRDARKIVEVGVGHRLDVAERVYRALPQAIVIVTDKDESWVRSRKSQGIRAVADDVRFPSLPLYRDTSLVYSINPPEEIIPFLEKFAKSLGADLLVVPTSDERHDFDKQKWREIMVSGRFVAWVLHSQS